MKSHLTLFYLLNDRLLADKKAAGSKKKQKGAKK